MKWTREDHSASALKFYYDSKEKHGDKYLTIRRERNKKSRVRNQADWLRYEAKSRAKDRGLEFNLEKEDIIIPSHCPVLGIEIKKHEGGRPWDNSPTIDRVDNSKGYTKENSRVISWRANRIKNNASLAELKAIIKYIEDHLAKQENVSSAAKLELLDQ